jgi:hypothetical protein
MHILVYLHSLQSGLLCNEHFFISIHINICSRLKMLRCKGLKHESYYNDRRTYILKLTSFISKIAVSYRTPNICVLINWCAILYLFVNSSTYLCCIVEDDIYLHQHIISFVVEFSLTMSK